MVKKAQIKIQQMAFVLIAVTLFFVLVGMFILTIKFSGLKESATELEEKNAILLVTKLANSPEFSCGESYGASRINCVDSDKIISLKEDIYSGFWGVEGIEIRKIYPKESTKICNLGNYNDCNVIKIGTNEISGNYISSFVSLCKKELREGENYDKCEIAKLMVSYKTK
ncbi:MAG: hypothetical protein QF567_02010 [Candidatus Pacearchaeota archaeon]|jgi:hypothetical protein|nr:hypothetical protein [Candidatus Pacearchaeota archaeon]|tara:strand:- start:58 stop:564 length:507 start_codon:yes stop_codon:yes gene_type:complete